MATPPAHHIPPHSLSCPPSPASLMPPLPKTLPTFSTTLRIVWATCVTRMRRDSCGGVKHQQTPSHDGCDVKQHAIKEKEGGEGQGRYGTTVCRESWATLDWPRSLRCCNAWACARALGNGRQNKSYVESTLPNVPRRCPLFPAALSTPAEKAFEFRETKGRVVDLGMACGLSQFQVEGYGRFATVPY